MEVCGSSASMIEAAEDKIGAFRFDRQPSCPLRRELTWAESAPIAVIGGLLIKNCIRK